MNYDFNQIVDRRNTNSLKWDRKGELLPMWVADMDFPSPPAVVSALQQRAAHGIFGYTVEPEGYYQAAVQWLCRRHGWRVDSAHLVSSPGVVTSIVAALLTFTKPGDRVIIQSPVYHPFFSVISDNGRIVVENCLDLEAGHYTMNLADLEAKIQEHQPKALILCSPHNPVGRVWQQEELIALHQICRRYDLLVISDEIWSDLVYRPNIHIPFASLNSDAQDRTITCIAPSKTFNLAGLTASLVHIAPADKRAMFQNTLRSLSLELGNLFGIVALQAAYETGEDWLEELLNYLTGNLHFLRSFLKNEMPQIHLVEPEGTYLAWLDCRGTGLAHDKMRKIWEERARVALNDGLLFGASGEGFWRLNYACPRSQLERALDRMANALTKTG